MVRIWLDKKELAINFSMEIVDIGVVFRKEKCLILETSTDADLSSLTTPRQRQHVGDWVATSCGLSM